MSKRGQVQEFNRNGPIVREDGPVPAAGVVTGQPDLSDPLNIPSASEEAVAESASASEADESETADEVVDTDLNNDGHDDATGEFVEGNTEAADEDEASAS